MSYQRKTEDEFQIWGNFEYGWEEVTAANTRKEAMQLLKDYRTNQPEGTGYHIKKKRIKKTQE